MRLDLKTHPASRIAHLNQHLGLVPPLATHRYSLIPTGQGLRFNPKPTTLRHGLPRIHGKMQKNLFEPFTVNLDIHRCIVDDEIQLN